MNDLKEQIFRATNDFLTTIRQLTQQHAELVFQETFSSLGSPKRAPASTKQRGVKRGTDELDQLSQRFTQFVHDNPGLRIEQINKQLGTTTAELALPIRKLVASGDLTVKGNKRSTTYFAGKSSGAPVATENGSEGGAVDTAAGKKSKKRSRPKKSARPKKSGTRAKAKK